MKTIEKICITALVAGTGLMIAGIGMEKDELSLAGAGIFAISGIGAVKYQKYLDKEKQKVPEEKEKYYYK